MEGTQTSWWRAMKGGLGLALVVAFFLGLVCFLAFQVRSEWRQRSLSSESRGWPRTTATVISSELHEWHGYRSSGCAPAVSYRYEVAGHVFQGTRVSFGWWSCDEARLTARSYIPGQEVPVFYRPESPATSVLRPDTWDGGVFLFVLVFSTVLLALPTTFLLLLALITLLPASLTKPLLAPVVAHWEKRRAQRPR